MWLQLRSRGFGPDPGGGGNFGFHFILTLSEAGTRGSDAELDGPVVFGLATPASGASVSSQDATRAVASADDRRSMDVATTHVAAI